jgi:hypothetical protein
VIKRALSGHPYSLDDGLGIRRIDSSGRMQTEVLALAPVLANHPVVEEAIRGRASRWAEMEMRSLAPVRSLDRSSASLHIVTELPAGVRLSHLLAHLEASGEVIAEPAIVELTSLIVNAVASLHAWPGGFAHGAINPAHIVLTSDGRVVLTDGVFGGGLEALQRNREALWKEFRLAMPPAANLARFDQQTDVTQMGAVILALLLQRPLRSSEYPRGVSDLVATATESAAIPGCVSRPAVRMWLQGALQIHSRLAFRSAVDAQRAFSELASSRDHGQDETALRALLQTACAEVGHPAPAVVNPPPARPTLPPHAAPLGQRRSGTFQPPRSSVVPDNKAR